LNVLAARFAAGLKAQPFRSATTLFPQPVRSAEAKVCEAFFDTPVRDARIRACSEAAHFAD